MIGPFAFQENSDSRRWEFPWAYSKISERGGGRNIVEIGGGMSGLQFVLARDGHFVTNIDPGLKARGQGWPVKKKLHERLCRLFNAPVKLIEATIAEAELEAESVDVVLTVSVLEHLTPAELEEVTKEVARILRPGGALIATVDLFLDLSPFTGKSRNCWGSNVDVKRVLDESQTVLVEGIPSELVGFAEFEPKATLERLSEFYVASAYPCLCQCLVSERRDT